MFYCSITSDEDTISSLKGEVEKLFRGSFDYQSTAKYISYYQKRIDDDEFVAIVKMYPNAEIEYVAREEEMDGYAYSGYGPGDGTARFLQFDFSDMLDEDEFAANPPEWADDYDTYVDEYFWRTSEMPEHQAKTADEFEVLL